MAIRRDTGFNPMTDRYAFDFKACTYEAGWVQVDTYQDASYFGIWTNPTARMIVTYAEGDISRIEADTDDEYVEILKGTMDCYTDGSDRWPHAKIDPGLGATRDAHVERFTQLGLAAYIH
jgi:hypothetical protein